MIQELMRVVLDAGRTPRSMAGWRNVIGDLAERFAAEKLGATQLSTGGSDKYCPDLRRGSVDYEVKAVGKSGQMLIYRERLDKDRRHAETHALCYVIVRHKVEIPQPSALEAKMLMDWAQLYVIPFCYVDAVCVGIKCRQIQNKYCRMNNYDGFGYYIPLTKLYPFAVRIV